MTHDEYLQQTPTEGKEDLDIMSDSEMLELKIKANQLEQKMLLDNIEIVYGLEARMAALRLLINEIEYSNLRTKKLFL